MFALSFFWLKGRDSEAVSGLESVVITWRKTFSSECVDEDACGTDATSESMSGWVIYNNLG